jgi:hypothetical protein
MPPRSALPVLLAAGLVACRTDGAPAPADARADATGDGPSAYEWQPDEGAAPSFDAATVEAALADVVDGMMTIGAAPVLDTYAGLMDQADEMCPAWYEQDGNVFWYAQCTAGSGTYFDGYGFTNVYAGAELFGEGGGLWDATVVSGAATIRDEDGHTFHLGGQVYDGTGWHEDGRLLWVSNVLGGFTWDGEGADETWLGAGISPGLLLYAIRYPEEAGFGVTGNYLYADGTVGGLGDAATGADLTGFSLISESLGVPCELEPGGTMSIRDADGVWWDVAFDLKATDTAWVLEGECDGCGAVYRDGDYQGEVCADFSPLLDWTDRPW